jgi:hypothetical protein
VAASVRPKYGRTLHGTPARRIGRATRLPYEINDLGASAEDKQAGMALAQWDASEPGRVAMQRNPSCPPERVNLMPLKGVRHDLVTCY